MLCLQPLEGSPVHSVWLPAVPVRNPRRPPEFPSYLRHPAISPIFRCLTLAPVNQTETAPARHKSLENRIEEDGAPVAVRAVEPRLLAAKGAGRPFDPDVAAVPEIVGLTRDRAARAHADRIKLIDGQFGHTKSLGKLTTRLSL
jgi:hypothetical protein